MAVLLPGVPFFLRLGTKAPARRLIEAGGLIEKTGLLGVMVWLFIT